MSDLAATELCLPPRAIFPERDEAAGGALDRLFRGLTGLALRPAPRFNARRLAAVLAAARALEAETTALDDGALSARIAAQRPLLRALPGDSASLAPAVAALAEVARRSLGQRPSDRQILAAFALLRGWVAELGPGRGKTLALALAAAAAALGGRPVQVIAPDDPRAAAAAEAMARFFEALGLTCGLVPQSGGEAERRAAYRCDVTYCSAQEIALDHLRDRLRLGQQAADLRLKLEALYSEAPRRDGLMLRGLPFGLLDDADEILLDQADQAVAVSKETSPEAEQTWAREALEIVAEVEPEAHFLPLAEESRVELTEAGRALLADRAEAMGGIWRARQRREDDASLALAALHLFHPGAHYRVESGRVSVTDPGLLRLLEQQAERGLLQLIEAKEACRISGRRCAQARSHLQRVFRRYCHLGGVTATAQEAAAEFRADYGMAVALLGGASQRAARVRIFPDLEAELRALVRLARDLRDQGLPLLIAVANTGLVEPIAAALAAAGLEPVRPDGGEGMTGLDEAGRITLLSQGQLALLRPSSQPSALTVVLAGRQPLRRLDRRVEQGLLRLRIAQGWEVLLARDDPLLQMCEGSLLSHLARLPGGLGRLCGRGLLWTAQRRLEAEDRRKRRDIVLADRRLGEILAFSGSVQ